jgi:hypothetical protein
MTLAQHLISAQLARHNLQKVARPLLLVSRQRSLAKH